ncbi:hypothetical protein BZG36_02059 [Bifiguratus adelaidae]|uniref:Uncharacterized protein n=1 Tax=Bifiguratus adelaidae TaxID=1938954 RepID=A0A261Y1W8_9FUNG|nr:hypothetical protein BZG36_02059 [Bifiguratus adelaidae]
MPLSTFFARRTESPKAKGDGADDTSSPPADRSSISSVTSTPESWVSHSRSGTQSTAATTPTHLSSRSSLFAQFMRTANKPVNAIPEGSPTGPSEVLLLARIASLEEALEQSALRLAESTHREIELQSKLVQHEYPSNNSSDEAQEDDPETPNEFVETQEDVDQVDGQQSAVVDQSESGDPDVMSETVLVENISTDSSTQDQDSVIRELRCELERYKSRLEFLQSHTRSAYADMSEQITEFMQNINRRSLSSTAPSVVRTFLGHLQSQLSFDNVALESETSAETIVSLQSSNDLLREKVHQLSASTSRAVRNLKEKLHIQSEKLLDLEQSHRSSLLENASLKLHNRQLKESSERADQQVKTLQQRLTDLILEHSKASAQARKQKDEIIVRLEAELKNAKQSWRAECNDFRQEIATKEAELQDRQVNIRELAAEKDRLESLHIEADSLRSANADLERALAELSSGMESVLRENALEKVHVDVAEQEVRRLRELLDKTSLHEMADGDSSEDPRSRRLVLLEGLKKETEARLEAVRQEKVETEDLLKQAKDSIRELKSQVRVLTNEKEALEGMHSKCQNVQTTQSKQIIQLEDDLQAQNTLTTSLSTALAEATGRSHQTIETLQERVKCLEEDLQKHRDRLQSANTTIEQLHTTLAELSSSQSELTASRDHLQAITSTLQASAAFAESNCKHLEAKLELLQSSHANKMEKLIADHSSALHDLQEAHAKELENAKATTASFDANKLHTAESQLKELQFEREDAEERLRIRLLALEKTAELNHMQIEAVQKRAKPARMEWQRLLKLLDEMERRSHRQARYYPVQRRQSIY